MISVKDQRVKINGSAEELTVDFVSLYQVMDEVMPDVLDRACNIIENMNEDDFKFIKFKDKRPGDIE